MRKIVLFICVCLSISCYPESRKPDDNIIDISGDWKMMYGNNSDFSRPEYNDNDWPSVALPSISLMPSDTTHLKFPHYSALDVKSKKGYIWFRKSIHLGKQPSGNTLLQIREIMNADKVFFNGRLIGKSGQFPPVFRSGWSKFRSYDLPVDYFQEKENIIAIQMYYNGECWISGPMEIVLEKRGRIRQIRYELLYNHLIQSLSLFLIIMFVLFLFFFKKRRKEKEYLYLAFANIGLTIAISLHYVENTYGMLDFSSNTLLRVTQIGLLSFPVFTLFFYKQYADNYIDKFRFCFYFGYLFISSATLLLVPDRHGILFWRNIFISFNLIVMADLLFHVFIQLKRGNRKGIIMLVGLLPVMLLGIHDVLAFSLKWIDSSTPFYVYGFPVLLIIISGHLVGRFIQSLNEAERLNIALKQYQTIFNNATDGIFQIDAEGHLVTANPALATMLGFETPAELMEENKNDHGEGFVDIFKKSDIQELLNQQNEIRDFELEYVRKDGNTIIVSLNILSVHDKNRGLMFYEGLLTNITQRKIAEKLKIEKKAAESANLAKSEFLTNMSHELRTPMQGILGFAKLGIDKISTISSDKIQMYFTQIYNSGQRLLLLLNDLLDLSKLEAGKFEYYFESINLIEIVEISIAEQETLLKEKNIAIDLCKPDSECILEVDKDKIMRLLGNILTNAIKFSEPNGKIKVNLENQEKNFRVSIFDNGIGIPEDELEKVFENFVQSNRTKDGSGGTGLGLSICKRIVEDHHGSIWAENNPNGGSVFHVTLPYRQEKAASSPTLESAV